MHKNKLLAALGKRELKNLTCSFITIFLAVVCIKLLLMEKSEAAPFLSGYTPPTWANKASLDDQFAGLSQKDNSAFIFNGIQTTVTADLISNPIQVTFALNAVDGGLGLDVSQWNFKLEVWKNATDYQNRTNGLSIPILLTSVYNLDGSALQTEVVGSNRTFKTLTDFGINNFGDTNYVFTTVISGQNLTNFQSGMVVGSDIFVGISNDSNADDGAHFSLVSDQIVNNSIYSTRPGLYYTEVGYGTAFEIFTEPSATSTPLSLRLESGTAVISLPTESDLKVYKIYRSSDLTLWVPCATHLGNGITHEYTEPVDGRAFFKATKSP